MKFVLFFSFLVKLILNFTLKHQQIESLCGKKNDKFFGKIIGMFGKKVNCEKESNKIAFNSESDKGKNVKCCELINNYLFEIRTKLREEKFKQEEVSEKILKKRENILKLFVNLRKEITVLKDQIPKQYTFATYLTGVSKIIKKQEDAKLLESWFVGEKVKLKLLYSSEKHGKSTNEFHSRADGKGPTVTIVESESGRIFGGYTKNSWHSQSQYTRGDGTDFLFSITKKAKLVNDRYPEYSIYGNPSYFPTFGGGHDLHISGNCFDSTNSYTNLGHSYGLNYNYDETRTSFLAGSYNFRVKKFEVYLVSFVYDE